MGTFGGPGSYVDDGDEATTFVSALNNGGTMVGIADTATPDPSCFVEECMVVHGFRWHSGVRTDLGPLVPGRSSYTTWVSANGLIAGYADNGTPDPLIAGIIETRGVLWESGRIFGLPMLPTGGYEAAANAVNSSGQVVGWATNTVPDANSMIAPGFFPTETRAVLWQNGAARDLGTLGTGTDAMAQYVTESGEVVGWSYTGASASCIQPGGDPTPRATHSFVWDPLHGMRDLGTIGGSECVFVTALNAAGSLAGIYSTNFERAFVRQEGELRDLGGSIGGNSTAVEAMNILGEVAGTATTAGEVTFHATLWRRIGDITDLGVVGAGAGACSFASSINAFSQVVGASSVDCQFLAGTSAFLWQDGSLYDLNALIAPGATLVLQYAVDINDLGEIAGNAIDADGNPHAYLLIPCAAAVAADCQEVVAGSPMQRGVAAARRNAVPRQVRALLRQLRTAYP
jgi:probable HAF family extracellular repeat protein